MAPRQPSEAHTGHGHRTIKCSNGVEVNSEEALHRNRRRCPFLALGTSPPAIGFRRAQYGRPRDCDRRRLHRPRSLPGQDCVKSRPPLSWLEATRAAILRECARTDRAVFTLEDLTRRELRRLCRGTGSVAEGSNSLRPTLFQLARRGEIQRIASHPDSNPPPLGPRRAPSGLPI